MEESPARGARQAGPGGAHQLRPRTTKRARHPAPEDRGQEVHPRALLPCRQRDPGPPARTRHIVHRHGGHRHQRELHRWQCGVHGPRRRQAGLLLASNAPRRTGRARGRGLGRGRGVYDLRRSRRRQHQQRSGQLGRCQSRSGRWPRNLAGRPAASPSRSSPPRGRRSAVLVRLRREAVGRASGSVEVPRGRQATRPRPDPADPDLHRSQDGAGSALCDRAVRQLPDGRVDAVLQEHRGGRHAHPGRHPRPGHDLPAERQRRVPAAPFRGQPLRRE